MFMFMTRKQSSPSSHSLDLPPCPTRSWIRLSTLARQSPKEQCSRKGRGQGRGRGRGRGGRKGRKNKCDDEDEEEEEEEEEEEGKDDEDEGEDHNEGGDRETYDKPKKRKTKKVDRCGKVDSKTKEATKVDKDKAKKASKVDKGKTKKAGKLDDTAIVDKAANNTDTDKPSKR